MSDSLDPLVWLPFDPAELGEVPAGLRYEVVDPREHVPDSVADVAFYVAPYAMGPAVGDVLPQMSGLEVVQVLSAGVDNVRSQVPQGVTLCNGRGIHDTSTAELTLTLLLASLRDVPGMVRDQDERRWNTRWRPALADKQVLLVGYGSIGRAIEDRLLPFECEVTRAARTARDGDRGPVHGFEELPDLVADADVVILVVPLTDETRGLVDAGLLARMKDGALVVNMARGPVVVAADLLAELHAGRLLAAVDVVDTEPLPADDPLWDAPGLLVSPHVGGATSAMWPRAHRLVRAQLERYAAGEALHNQMTGAY
ncbi:Glyoxylate/hydroxypyruvate reductase B [Nocardioides dokdonensis FR1436]|uniref:Glyoxylate/hydroxypyruvate reductase B n=1 Tax=Nocardioides dokdonensis FR1436 TaxID=1300347 RepID=A0A1A9GRQ8_9ACTN|nr:2-hydroxyacid dehydrogenase [Nocardioides dokdonensis]ANH40145.1 Glyoxylate/hydroxypyruvate reductase B [Nocardioides dokdonensis FR1436]